MVVYLHRGLWSEDVPQNSLEAFTLAFNGNFGVELDIWSDASGDGIFIGHDIQTANLEFEEFLTVWNKSGRNPLAINVKCDGLGPRIKKYFESYSITDWRQAFLFDMSFPEFVVFNRLQIPTASRLSEYETLQNYHDTDVIWLDAFNSDWWCELPRAQLQQILAKSVVVSPELHKRSDKFVTEFLKNFHFYGICKDPE